MDRLDPVGEHEVAVLQVVAQVQALGAEQPRASAADVVQAPRRGVDADDPKAGAAQCDRARQTRVAEADDGDERLGGHELVCDPRAGKRDLAGGLSARDHGRRRGLIGEK